VLDDTTPLTLTNFNYVTRDEGGNMAFRASYWLTDSLVTKPGLFIYRMEQGKIYPIVGYEDVGAPRFEGRLGQYVYFSFQESTDAGLRVASYRHDIDQYDTDTNLPSGSTLANGDVLTFTLQDRVVSADQAGSSDISFTGRAGGGNARGVFWCSGLHPSYCSSNGVRIVGDGDPAPNSRTLQFTGTFPYISTGPEIVYNANLSSTTGITYGIVMSDTDSLVSLVEEGEALPGGGTVTAIANVSILPNTNKLGTVAAIVDVSSGTTGEQRLLLIDRDDSYAEGSILNHVVLEYANGILVTNASPYIVNSVFANNNGVEDPHGSSVAGVVGIFGTIDRTLHVKGCTISDNEWPSGISVLLDSRGRVDISGNTIRNNHISYGWAGGGIHVSASYPTVIYIHYNDITYNSSDQPGGGIGVGGGAIVESNRIANNRGIGGGGGLYANGGLIRFNVIASNIENSGWEPGNSLRNNGGSGLQLDGTVDSVQYNTILANVSEPLPGSDSVPGPSP